MRVAIFMVGSVLALLCCQPVLAADAVFTVIDAAGKSHPFTADDIAALPQHTLKAKAHGVENEFTGVSLVDLLQAVGVEFGEKLRGARASDVAVVEAADGYRTVFALVEIDPATTDKVVLVADKKDGQLLGEKEGPLRLVVPDEKRPVRWARMIKTLRIVQLNELPRIGKAATGDR